MAKSPVPQEIRQRYIQEGLDLRKQGKSQPDLEYNGQKYFLDNKGKNHGGWRLRNRGSHSAQGSKRRADQRDATPTKADYERAYGKKKGGAMYVDYKKQMSRIWSSRGTPGMDVDHMNSLASGGVEHPNNMRLQNSSTNRSEGARQMSSAQKNAMMLADNVPDQIKLQGPKPTPRIRMKIMNGAMKLNAMTPITEYLAAFDEITGNHIDTAIKNGVNSVRKALGLAPNKH